MSHHSRPIRRAMRGERRGCAHVSSHGGRVEIGGRRGGVLDWRDDRADRIRPPRDRTTGVGDVAVVIVDNPPVNALELARPSGPVRRARRGRGRGRHGVVVICDGRTFIAGADISEFGGAPAGASACHEVQAAMEDFPMPVIAAIHGTALGGGLEVALAAHYRVARVVGEARPARGEPRSAARRRRHAAAAPGHRRPEGARDDDVGPPHQHRPRRSSRGLVDEVVDGDRWPSCETAAIAFAERAVAEDLPLLRVRDRDDKVARRRATPSCSPRSAPRSPGRRVASSPPSTTSAASRRPANLPFEEGMQGRGATLHGADDRSAVRRAALRVLRRARRRQDPRRRQGHPVLDIRTCGVLGAGTMGGGIAMNFANVGIPVTIVERDQAALDRGLAVVRKNYERSASRGSIPPEAVERAHGADHRLDRQGRLRRRATSSSRRSSRTWS